jgi:hypothetical protein
MMEACDMFEISSLGDELGSKALWYLDMEGVVLSRFVGVSYLT